MTLFENTTPAPIALVDGADPITTGTAVDQAFYNALKAALNAQLHSASDPTVMPSDIIAAVATARGVYASLAAKLTAMEALFTGVGPSTLRNGFALGNFIANGDGRMWSRGDAAAPDYWVLTGTGAAVARTGPGLADTTSVNDRADSFAAKVTYGSDAAALSQYVFRTALGSALDEFFASRFQPVDAQGNTIAGYGGGAADSALQLWYIGHVWCDGTNRARLRLTGSAPATSEYHPGSSAWRTLVAGPLTAVVGTPIQAQRRVETAGSAYFMSDCVVATELGLPPLWIPEKTTYRTHRYYVNNPATGVLDYFVFARPAFILGAQIQCLTAGTVTAPTIDLLTPIGGVYSSLFVTLPTIATGQLQGAFQMCNPAAANYRRRTIRPALTASATQADNTSLRLDYVDDGGGSLRDLMVTIHYLEYDRPLDQFRGSDDLGESA